MIFLGDIAFPGNLSLISEDFIKRFGYKPIIANLEGPITSDINSTLKKRVLFNSLEIIDELTKVNISLLNLANNHILDLGETSLFETQEILKKNNIQYIGAGKSLAEAEKSQEIKIGDKSYVFLSFGWEVIQCKIATNRSSGVNPFKVNHVLKSLKTAKINHPDSHLIVLFHWNYELEKYPQPGHRELAKELIDIGVDLIIGHHPHIVNGIEVYKGKPIVYSLGNWFIPHNYFWDGKLSYPEESNIQLAFEWDIEKDQYLSHWFKFDPVKNQVNYIESKNLEEDDRAKELTPFSGMDKVTYEKWFRKNRIKKKGLPIYKWNDSKNIIQLKNKWNNLRDYLIQILLKTGLK